MPKDIGTTVNIVLYNLNYYKNKEAQKDIVDKVH